MGGAVLIYKNSWRELSFPFPVNLHVLVYYGGQMEVEKMSFQPLGKVSGATVGLCLATPLSPEPHS